MNQLEIRPLAPFWLEATVRGLQRLPHNRVDVWQDGRYWRVLAANEDVRLISVEETGTVDRPLLRVRIHGSRLVPVEEGRLAATLGEILGATVDIEGFYRIAQEEPYLRAAVTALRGLKPSRFPTLFEAIVNSVVFQQISLAAATAIAGRLAERFGRVIYNEGRTFFGSPEPAGVVAASAEELRALGLSGRNAEVLRALAEMVLEGDLSVERLRSLPTQEAIVELSRLRGIGHWTAEVILLRGLGRLDAFPHGDVGVRKGLGRLLGMDRPLNAAEEEALLAGFGDLRGCLYFYSLGWRLRQQGLLREGD